MKTIRIKPFVLVLILAISAYSQAQSNNKITIGHIDTLYSEILEESREIWIHVPNAEGDQLFKDTYPVLYLLDGDGHFSSVMGLIDQLSSYGNTVLPKMVIVGITNTNRWRDLTPTHDEKFSPSGGGDLFLDFVEKELMTYIEETYPVAENRTFVGHSLGGLTVINTLLNRPELFNNYIAIDPSLWWDERYTLKRSDSLIGSLELKNKSLYVSIANTMDEGMEYTTIMSDTTEASNHIRSILEFVNKVDKEYSTDLNFKWKYYGDDSHMSVPLITEYDGLRFIYSWYECDCNKELYNRETELTGAELLGLLTSHYELVSDKMGYRLNPKEEEINELGYWFLENEEYKRAFHFFEYNILNFPKSFNAFDSMGDYYVAVDDLPNAIKSFEKSLELGGMSYTEDKLKAAKEN